MAEPQSDPRREPAGAPSTTPDPEFLRVFTALRARLAPEDVRAVRLLERLARRRLPPASPTVVQRGEDAEPPPVLDLRLDRPEDGDDLLRLLRNRCGNHPVWLLPDHGPPEEGRVREEAAGAAAPGPGVTTQELYDELAVLARGFDAAPEAAGAPPGRKAPSAARFRRLTSLLWLREVDVPAVHQRVTGGEEREEDVELPTGRVSEVYVIEALRKVRAGLSHRSRTREPRWTDTYYNAMERLSAAVAKISRAVTFGKLDEKVLSPLSFLVGAIATITPLAFLGLTAEKVSEAATVLAALGLAAVYTGLALFLFLPWRHFLWLNRHRYQLLPGEEPAGLNNHRERGIRVANVLHRGRGLAGTAPGQGQPPGIHRLAVNAFLDDLDRVYGSGRRGHRLLPRRRRDQRPVLIADQRRIGRVGRYLVRLIEEERLRRRYPDPLLVVLVRPEGEEPLVDARVDADRYPDLPEARLSTDAGAAASPGPVREWRRRRHALGALGERRTITCPVPARDPEWEGVDAEVRRVFVWSAPALAAFASGGLAAAAALALLLGWIVVPGYVQNRNPCVEEGVRPPQGITRAGGECVGISDGSFPFASRLEAVQERLWEQNEEVVSSGNPYVTVVYVGELSVREGASEDRLAGVQGELAGLAVRQETLNEREDTDGRYPGIRILQANVGSQWSHSEAVAESIADLARRDGKVLAAVGFGHSVSGNTEAIGVLNRAGLVMVGSTATYDDVAVGEGGPSPFFFPVAPSNSRIAVQAARWAYHGARTTVAADGEEEGQGRETELELLPARTAAAVADDSSGELYGPHLAERFMREFTALGGRAHPARADDTTLSTGFAPAEGLLPYGAANQPTLRQRATQICADPPDLIYYAGRSNHFGTFYELITRQGACADGRVTILGGDDIAKYVTDYADELGPNAEDFPVFYTPLAASGSWGTAGVREQSFYHAVQELITELGEADDPDERPSVAHAAMAGDTLLVVAEAVQTAHDEQFGGAGEEETGVPSDLRKVLTEVDQVTGASGRLSFGAQRDGHWYPDKLVQLAAVGPDGGQHVVENCGFLTATLKGSGANC